MRSAHIAVLFIATATPAALAQTQSYQVGLSDRTGYETWFEGLTGDYRLGAAFWATHRSDPKPPLCSGAGLQKTGEWLRGCLDAAKGLAPVDARRLTDPAYRQGWNSYQVPIVQPPTAPSQQADATGENGAALALCRGVSDSLDRLRCYDAIVSGQPASSSAPAPAPAPVVALSPPVLTQTEPSSKGDISAPPKVSSDVAAADCKTNWRQCKDNGDLVNNYTRLYEAVADCKIKANEQAKYGTPEWPGFWSGGAFSSYLPGSDYPSNGIVTLIENDVQFQNGYGAMVHSRAVCEYDLKASVVKNINIIQR